MGSDPEDLSASDLEQLSQLLEGFGCPAGKSLEMARQLDKRARQLAAKKKRPYTEAMAYLLNLMRQGAANDTGHASPADDASS